MKGKAFTNSERNSAEETSRRKIRAEAFMLLTEEKGIEGNPRL